METVEASSKNIEIAVMEQGGLRWGGGGGEQGGLRWGGVLWGRVNKRGGG